MELINKTASIHFPIKYQVQFNQRKKKEREGSKSLNYEDN